MASVSRLAGITAHTMRQVCTIYRYAGADDTGQPVYHDGIATRCRLAIRTRRVLDDAGDYITNQEVVVIVPADTAIQAMDMVDLPAPYQQGAVVASVATATDMLGNVTHQAVRIA